jgi:hypothetical protein
VTSQLVVSLSDQSETDEVIKLYRANGWSSAEKPRQAPPGSKELGNARHRSNRE